MNVPINAKRLRATLSEVVERVRKGTRRSLLFQYRDKDLSLRDCTSFAILREVRLTTVITTNGHFRQVGFDVLPVTRPRRSRKPRARE